MSNLQHCRGCVLKPSSAALSEEFGLSLFLRKAGERAPAILEELGTYKSGPRKGKQKGFIHWLKVVEGGFDYQGGRGVLRGGCIEFRVAKEYGTQLADCDYDL